MVGGCVEASAWSTNIVRTRGAELVLSSDIEELCFSIKLVVCRVCGSTRELWEGSELRSCLTLSNFSLLHHLGDVGEGHNSIEEEGSGEK